MAYRELVEADSLRDKGQYSQAIKAIQTAQRIYERGKYRVRVIDCLVRYASILDAADLPIQCMQALRKAQNYASLYPKLNLHRLKADIDLKFAELYIPMRKSDSVTYFLNRAEPVFDKIKDWEKFTYCEILRAGDYYYASNFKCMEVSLSLALQRAKQKLPQTNDTFSVIYRLQGVMYDALGDYEKAIMVAQDGLRAVLAKPRLTSLDSSYVVTFYNNIGAMYYSKGDYDRTIDYYTQALQFAMRQKSPPVPTLLSIYQNIGSTYNKQGNTDRAMAFYMQSMKYTQGAYVQQIAAIYFKISGLFIKQKNSQQALYYLQKGALLQKNEQKDIEIYYLRKAECYVLQRQFQQALDTYEVAIQASQHNQNAPTETIIRQKMADVYLQQKNYRDALQQVKQGLAIVYPSRRKGGDENAFQLSQTGDRLSLLELLCLKSKIYQQWAVTAITQPIRQQRLQTCHRLNQTITTLYDTLRLNYPWENSKYLLAQKASPFYKGAMEVALQLHQLIGQELYLNHAFGFAEKNRAVVLQDALADTHARQHGDIPEKVWNDEKRLRINLIFYTRKLIEATASKDSLRMTRYQQYLFENRRKLEALTTNFQKTYPEYYQLRHDTRPVSLQAVQVRLSRSQSSFIEYAEGVDDLYAFCITPTTRRVVRIGKIRAIEQQVNRLRTSLTDYAMVTESSSKAYNLFTQSAYQLYNVLIKPVVPIQNAFPKHLTIVPIGSLSYVPFDNLLDASPVRSKSSSYARLPYLVRKTAISYAYSASLFVDVSPVKSTTQAGTLLAFAPAYSSANQRTTVSPMYRSGNQTAGETPLSETQQEVKQITGYFNGQAYLDKSATKSQFLQLAEGYDVIHLAMHSRADEQNSNQNTLFFTPEKKQSNSHLDAYEVGGLQLNARMTVLSGCETGYGTYQVGEGVLSLARSFILAGSKSVVMSLWKAEDRASASIMDLFYKGLADGLSKDEALRQAKLTYIDKSDDLTGHPLFWSGIVVIGDASPLVLPKHKILLWLSSLVLILLTILAWRHGKTMLNMYFFTKAKFQSTSSY
ncbi:CHAT domain-containing protein [Spirosoma fluviale]|nr:CHAT domain-containing tetratricopeptide repeat protein [Spirosoma fluviale]